MFTPPAKSDSFYLRMSFSLATIIRFGSVDFQQLNFEPSNGAPHPRDRNIGEL